MQAWPLGVPLGALAAGAGATVLVGGISGLYPALRAARLSPTAALAITVLATTLFGDGLRDALDPTLKGR